MEEKKITQKADKGAVTVGPGAKVDNLVTGKNNTFITINVITSNEDSAKVSFLKADGANGANDATSAKSEKLIDGVDIDKKDLIGLVREDKGTQKIEDILRTALKQARPDIAEGELEELVNTCVTTLRNEITAGEVFKDEIGKEIRVKHLFDNIDSSELNHFVGLANPIMMGSTDPDRSSDPAKKRFYVFLSAITTKKGTNEHTLEYKVALRLKEFFNAVGIGTFWWEDEEMKSMGFRIADKIAMGLAFSSVFVGLSFDSVTQNGAFYRYDSLLEDDNENVYKKPNFFRYEVETFRSFTNIDVDVDGNENAKDFLSQLSPASEYLPEASQRKLCFVTYGNAKEGDIPSCLNGIDPICLKNELTAEGEEALIKQIVKETVSTLCRRDEKIKTALQASVYSSKSNQDDFRDIVQNYFDGRQVSDEELFPGYVEDSATPGDYTFNYIVLDDVTGEDYSRKIKLFIERDFNGFIPVITLNAIITDWNDAFCEETDIVFEKTKKEKLQKQFELLKYERVFFTNQEYGINKADSKDLEEGEVIDYKKYTENDCKVTVTSSALGGSTGSIVFFDEKGNERRFNYVVNLIARKKFYYSYSVKGDKLSFRFKEALPEKVRKIRLLYANTIPCENTKRQEGRGIHKEEITLSATSEDSKTLETKAYGGERAEYRLEFDGSDSLFNLFVYESDRKKKRSRGLGSKESAKEPDCYFESVAKHSLRCIYCAKKLKVTKGKLTYIFTNCQGDEIRLGSVNKQLVRLGADLKGDKIPNKEKNAFKARVFCDASHRLDDDLPVALPVGFDTSKSAAVALLAPSQVGKSVFLSKLLGMRYASHFNKNGKLSSDDCVDKIEASMSYVLAATYPLFSEISLLNVQTPVIGSDKESPFDLEVLWDVDLEGLPMKAAYTPFAYQQYIKGTSGEDSEMLMSRPFVLELKNRIQGTSYLSIFDVAGNSATITQKSMVRNADCVILMINPNDPTTISEAKAQLMNYKKEYNKGIPIAVICAQMDTYEDEFSRNCSKLRLLPPYSDSKVFHGSPLERYIMECDEEIRAYLSVNPESRNNIDVLITEIKNLTQRFMFFAVSSTGRRDTVHVVSQAKKYLRYNANPRGIENVLFWIAYQMGMID